MTIEPSTAIVEYDVIDVMQYVAHFTDGPEPPKEQAQEWLDNNANRMEEAMHYAAAKYIKDRWSLAK